MTRLKESEFIQRDRFEACMENAKGEFTCVIITIPIKTTRGDGFWIELSCTSEFLSHSCGDGRGCSFIERAFILADGWSENSFVPLARVRKNQRPEELTDMDGVIRLLGLHYVSSEMFESGCVVRIIE